MVYGVVDVGVAVAGSDGAYLGGGCEELHNQRCGG